MPSPRAISLGKKAFTISVMDSFPRFEEALPCEKTLSAIFAGGFARIVKAWIEGIEVFGV